MKKYEVCVHYQADVHMEIEAENEEQAQTEAMRRAASECPYDDLYFEVAYIDCEDEKSDE